MLKESLKILWNLVLWSGGGAGGGDAGRGKGCIGTTSQAWHSDVGNNIRSVIEDIFDFHLQAYE